MTKPDRLSDLWPTPTRFESARSVGRQRESDELPDVGREAFDSDEDYDAWRAEGSLRFFSE